MITFKHYTQLYLAESRYEKAHSTYISEKSKVKNLLKAFKAKNIDEITHSDIKQWKLKVHRRFGNKTINEHFIILRAIFCNAIGDGVIAINPMAEIENLKTHTKAPTPFTQDELLTLNNTEAECDSGKALLLLGILCGLRISELLALTWNCVDFDGKRINVDKAKVLGSYKVPKTAGSVRWVELSHHGIELLKRHYDVTGRLRPRVIRVLQNDNKTIDKQRVQHVFINSKTNKPFIDSKQYSKTFFTHFLKRAGVSHRGPNQLRHTFASHCLTAGISKEWIARQLGHNSTGMVDKHYARWIAEDAPDNVGKFSKAIEAVFGKQPNGMSKPLHSKDESPWASHTSCIHFTPLSISLMTNQSKAHDGDGRNTNV